LGTTPSLPVLSLRFIDQDKISGPTTPEKRVNQGAQIGSQELRSTPRLPF
jgi:hypothetical protein